MTFIFDRDTANVIDAFTRDLGVNRQEVVERAVSLMYGSRMVMDAPASLRVLPAPCQCQDDILN